MGCGSSKDKQVAPADQPRDPPAKAAEPASSQSRSTSKSKKTNKPPPSSSRSEAVVDGATQKTKYERGKSWTVDVEGGDGRPKTPGGMPDRLKERLNRRGKTPTTTEELDEKQRSADRRRELELERKREIAAEEDRKVEEAAGRLDDKVAGYSRTLEREGTMAEQRREDKLAERQKAGQVAEQKGKKARKRRHEIAMQEAQNLETGVDGDDDDTEEKGGGQEEW